MEGAHGSDEANVGGAHLSQAGWAQVETLNWTQLSCDFEIFTFRQLINSMWNSSVDILRHFQHTFSTIAAIVVSF